MRKAGPWVGRLSSVAWCVGEIAAGLLLIWFVIFPILGSVFGPSWNVPAVVRKASDKTRPSQRWEIGYDCFAADDPGGWGAVAKNYRLDDWFAINELIASGRALKIEKATVVLVLDSALQPRRLLESGALADRINEAVLLKVRVLGRKKPDSSWETPQAFGRIVWIGSGAVLEREKPPAIDFSRFTNPRP
jgi:hypothetical protein